MLLSFVVTIQAWAGELPKRVGKGLLQLSGNI
ncbi:MAG TPA: oxidoreductase, partial [Leclercia adecarboxylata]|nr:oxidoreductase [Leclercia adecarboxylata]